jgi:hypothetical protein
MHRGTILFAARRTRFVVLAADRLYHGRGRPPILEPKIVLHPTLPAAVACAGLRRLPLQGPLVVGQVRDVLAHFRSRGGLTMEALRARLAKGLAGHARAAYRAEADPALRGKTRCELFLALATGREAQLGRLAMQEDVLFADDEPEALSAPAHLVLRLEAEHGRGAGRDAYLGAGLEGIDRVAARALAIAEEAVRIDGEIMGEDARECGGPIDLVVVDRTGARPYGSPG